MYIPVASETCICMYQLHRRPVYVYTSCIGDLYMYIPVASETCICMYQFHLGTGLNFILNQIEHPSIFGQMLCYLFQHKFLIKTSGASLMVIHSHVDEDWWLVAVGLHIAHPFLFLQSSKEATCVNVNKLWMHAVLDIFLKMVLCYFLYVLGIMTWLSIMFF